jgi:predicted RNA-binding protein YlxR (DUF448 family)
VPRRRCVGCGRTAPTSELVRIALAGERGQPNRKAVLDPGCRMQGRGAYLCRSQAEPEPLADCLARAVRNSGIARTLRAKATLDDKLVESIGR